MVISVFNLGDLCVFYNYPFLCCADFLQCTILFLFCDFPLVSHSLSNMSACMGEHIVVFFSRNQISSQYKCLAFVQ
jgi:hypothetical protein